MVMPAFAHRMSLKRVRNVCVFLSPPVYVEATDVFSVSFWRWFLASQVPVTPRPFLLLFFLVVVCFPLLFSEPGITVVLHAYTCWSTCGQNKESVLQSISLPVTMTNMIMCSVTNTYICTVDSGRESALWTNSFSKSRSVKYGFWSRCNVWSYCRDEKKREKEKREWRVLLSFLSPLWTSTFSLSNVSDGRENFASKREKEKLVQCMEFVFTNPLPVKLSFLFVFRRTTSSFPHLFFFLTSLQLLSPVSPLLLTSYFSSRRKRCFKLPPYMHTLMYIHSYLMKKTLESVSDSKARWLS